MKILLFYWNRGVVVILLLLPFLFPGNHLPLSILLIYPQFLIFHLQVVILITIIIKTVLYHYPLQPTILLHRYHLCTCKTIILVIQWSKELIRTFFILFLRKEEYNHPLSLRLLPLSHSYPKDLLYIYRNRVWNSRLFVIALLLHVPIPLQRYLHLQLHHPQQQQLLLQRRQPLVLPLHLLILLLVFPLTTVIMFIQIVLLRVPFLPCTLLLYPYRFQRVLLIQKRHLYQMRMNSPFYQTVLLSSLESLLDSNNRFLMYLIEYSKQFDFSSLTIIQRCSCYEFNTNALPSSNMCYDYYLTRECKHQKLLGICRYRHLPPNHIEAVITMMLTGKVGWRRTNHCVLDHSLLRYRFPSC